MSMSKSPDHVAAQTLNAPTRLPGRLPNYSPASSQQAIHQSFWLVTGYWLLATGYSPSIQGCSAPSSFPSHSVSPDGSPVKLPDWSSVSESAS